MLVSRGMQPSEFWELSWGEVRMITKAHVDRRLHENQEAAFIAWRQAEIIGRHVAFIFGAKVKPQDFEKSFPEFMPEEEMQELEWQRIRNRMQRNAERINGTKK